VLSLAFLIRYEIPIVIGAETGPDTRESEKVQESINRARLIKNETR